MGAQKPRQAHPENHAGATKRSLSPQQPRWESLSAAPGGSGPEHTWAPSSLLVLDNSKRDQGSRPPMPQPWPLNWDKAAWQLGQPGLAFSPFGVKGWETNVSPPLEGRLRLQAITPAHQSPVYGTATAMGRQAFGLYKNPKPVRGCGYLSAGSHTHLSVTLDKSFLLSRPRSMFQYFLSEPSGTRHGCRAGSGKQISMKLTEPGLRELHMAQEGF